MKKSMLLRAVTVGFCSFFALGFSTIFGLLGGITISGLLLLLEFGDFHIKKFFEKREREKRLARSKTRKGPSRQKLGHLKKNS